MGTNKSNNNRNKSNTNKSNKSNSNNNKSNSNNLEGFCDALIGMGRISLRTYSR